jgi:serine/threonine protein kinase/Tfp pilus assembly protein PilF
MYYRSARDPVLSAGTRLGPHEIVAPLGAGGMGEVYRARDTRLGRDVAIKVLPADLAADPDRLRRFGQEARATAALNHPNILAIHDLGTHEGSPYLVEELLEGSSLRERLKDGTLPCRSAVEIARQIASGLAAAHAKGIFHRDLKPENVFVTTDGIVKILDFGLAKLDTRFAGAETATAATTLIKETARGVLVGTVPYMAPEQARGMPVDQRADVFAFGVVLYEMLGGERPFRGATPTDTVAAILKDEPSPLPAHVPAALAAVVRRCLAKEPGQRYQGGGELKAALDALQHATGSDRHDPRPEAARSRQSADRSLLTAVVVLPLLNLSSDPEQEYFADGMTEALIADLAKVRALRVISRTSAMRYKATEKSLPEIASELGVDGVVEGSVMRVGQRVRITAQLIHAATDSHLWAESYERGLEDVLLLQSEVARAIVGEIRVAVTADEARRLASPRRVDPEAYDACLKGRSHYYRLSREHLDTALQYFHLALEKDPGCARAWAGIAATWVSLSDAGFLPPHEAIPKAKEAALRALELDESLVEVRVNLANIKFCCEWDWSGAEQEFRQAIELDPNSAEARFFYADFLISMGRNDEAVTEARRALELDPFSFFLQGFFGWHLVYLRRCDDAIAHLRKTLQMEAEFSSAHLGLWGAFYRKGLREEALAAARRFFAALGDGEVVEALRRGESESGYEGGMRLAALELERRAATAHVPAIRIARLWAHAGDADRALEWLEKAHAWGESPLVHLRVGWDWDSLRDDPRFQSLLHRMKLPETAAGVLPPAGC